MHGSVWEVKTREALVSKEKFETQPPVSAPIVARVLGRIGQH